MDLSPNMEHMTLTKNPLPAIKVAQFPCPATTKITACLYATVFFIALFLSVRSLFEFERFTWVGPPTAVAHATQDSPLRNRIGHLGPQCSLTKDSSNPSQLSLLLSFVTH